VKTVDSDSNKAKKLSATGAFSLCFPCLCLTTTHPADSGDGVSEVMIVRVVLGSQAIQPHQNLVILVDTLDLSHTHTHNTCTHTHTQHMHTHTHNTHTHTHTHNTHTHTHKKN